MSNLTEIEASLKERNLEKFKSQVESLPSYGHLDISDRPTHDAWGRFLIRVHNEREANKEYIAILRECPDKLIAQNLNYLDKKDVVIKAADQLIQSLMNVEIHESNQCRTVSASAELTGEELTILQDDAIRVGRVIFSQLRRALC